MNAVRQLGLVLVLGLGTLGLAACDDGPAENVGEKVDRAVENLGNTVNPQGPGERVGETLDNAAERTGEAIENAGEAVQRQAR